jgi:hypothetical protein
VSLEERFKELTALWNKETAGSSSLTVICGNEHYKGIIRLGRLVVPLIMEDLKKGPNHWFIALREITGEQPHIPDEDAGRIRKIGDLWLKWWEEHELTWCRKEQDLFALKWETGIFHNFYPSTIQMSLCGDPPYYRVRLTPNSEGEYWAWHDFAKDVYNFANHNRNGVIICFPYGPEIEEKLGRGEIIRVRVDELGVA